MVINACMFLRFLGHKNSSPNHHQHDYHNYLDHHHHRYRRHHHCHHLPFRVVIITIIKTIVCNSFLLLLLTFLERAGRKIWLYIHRKLNKRKIHSNNSRCFGQSILEQYNRKGKKKERNEKQDKVKSEVKDLFSRYMVLAAYCI